MLNWRQQFRRPIGLDIGVTSVRAVQFRRRDRSWELLAAGETDLDPSADGPSAAIQDAVRRLRERHGFRGRQVIVNLPTSAMEIKNMRLPQMPAAELSAAAEFEARERFQDLGDVIIRTLPAGLVGRVGEEQQEMIVLAARTDAVEARLRLLTELGLVVEGIEPTFSAFFRPLAQYLQRAEDSQLTSACVDMGAGSSRVIIARGAEIVFVKACGVGGETFDRAVADALNTPLPEAAAIRRRCLSTTAHTDESAAVLAALKTPLEQLGREIGLCLRYYAVTFRGDRPNAIACGGSEAAYAAIREGLAQATGLPIVASESWRGIACGSFFTDAERATGLPGWMTAVGLALNEGRMALREQRVA